MIAAVGALGALALIVIACRVKSGGVMLVVLALLFLTPAGYVLIALNPQLVDGRFGTYKRFYRDIRIGMTRDQVLALMERRYSADGPRMRPKIIDDSPEGLGFFMNPETSREPNCEGIFLTLEQGRVTKKAYSPD